MNDSICPCRLMAAEKLSLAACCGPNLEAPSRAPTAEAQMRARYSAYVLGKLDFIHDTMAPETRKDFDRKSVARWSSQSQWLGLEVQATENGQPGDAEGVVDEDPSPDDSAGVDVDPGQDAGQFGGAGRRLQILHHHRGNA